MEMKQFEMNMAKVDFLDWKDGEHDGKKGILIKNNQSETVTHVTYDALEQNDWDIIQKMTWQGKHVEHMTRVTGYFSKVSGWNKGKTGELKDRHRVSM